MLKRKSYQYPAKERQTEQETNAIKAACHIHGSQERETPRATQGHVGERQSRSGAREGTLSSSIATSMGQGVLPDEI